MHYLQSLGGKNESDSHSTESDNSRRPLLGDFHPLHILQVIGFLGLLYFSGSIANLGSYSFMKGNDILLTGWLYPVVQNQLKIVTDLSREPAKDSVLSKQITPRFNQREDTNHTTLTTYPFLVLDSLPPDPNSFTKYLYQPISELAYWNAGNRKPRNSVPLLEMVLTQARIRAYHKGANDELLKFLRLDRAFVFFIFWIGLFACIKTIAFLMMKFYYQWRMRKIANDEYVLLNKPFLWFIDFKRYERARLFKIITMKERGEIAHNVTFEGYTAENSIKASKHYILHKIQSGLNAHFCSFMVAGILYTVAVKYWYEIALYYHCNIIGVYMASYGG